MPKPEHLIAMKLLAMKNDPKRTFQQMADIQFLMASAEVDRQKIRRYFERHGLLATSGSLFNYLHVFRLTRH